MVLGKGGVWFLGVACYRAGWLRLTEVRDLSFEPQLAFDNIELTGERHLHKLAGQATFI